MSLKEVFDLNRLEPRGVVHIGGEGEELDEYLDVGFGRILFIQPDPEKFQKIQEKITERQALHVLGVMALLSNKNGYVEYDGRLTATRRLDTLLIELRVHPKQFNCLNTRMGHGPIDAGDIGAEETWKYLDVVKGSCTVDPFLNLWQDPAHGRFANELFQYFMAIRLAHHHGLELRTTPWAGQALFGLNNSPLHRPAPTIIEHEQKRELSALEKSLTPEAAGTMRNFCLGGHYQFHTGGYDEIDRDRFRTFYAPVPALEKRLNTTLAKCMGDAKTLVVIHCRRGDYAQYPGHNMFYITPAESYRKWLAEIWPMLVKPRLYIASDDPNAAADFMEYAPFTDADMGMNIAERFYPDFWVMTQAHALAISNSSFSFAAAMLNDMKLCMGIAGMPDVPGDTAMFVRPQRDGTLIPFDPWDAEVLLGREDRPVGASSEIQCLDIIKQALNVLDPLKEGRFIEVGLGTFAWYFDDFANAGYECCLVEPFPTDELLMTANNRTNVDIFRGVIGNTDGGVQIYKGRDPNLNSLIPGWWGLKEGAAPVLVPSMTLDTFTKTIDGPIACLKLDVEGAEFQILRQLAFLPKEKLPRVVMFEYGGTPRVEGKGGWTPEAMAYTAAAMEVLYTSGYRRGIMVENNRQPKDFEFGKVAFEQLADHDANYGNLIAFLPL